MSRLASTLTPFLYPSFDLTWSLTSRRALVRVAKCSRRHASSQASTEASESHDAPPAGSHLNPSPEDYGRTVFKDKCRLILQAGSGGHGCVSFLREIFIAAGPANGGDGGSGGNIYIQAVKGETSLHKLAHQRFFRATNGRNGQGKSKGGQRGEDVLLQVPLGTVVREVARVDPVAAEEEARKLAEDAEEEIDMDGDTHKERRDKWIMAPNLEPSELANLRLPKLPRGRRSNLAAIQPKGPIFLDLTKPMEEPMLLAAGAVGGLGNPHFVTKSLSAPKYATKGGRGMRLEIELELKLLADLGFVGLPNAGKSTLLRAITNSRARVGNWAFTTLQPNIGTVVLDNNHGRAKLEAFDANGERKTQFSIADIPGIVPDAHLDRGLGLDFLRHIERARVLAFVVDLGNGDAVETLKTLWRELDEFETLKEHELNLHSEKRIVNWQAFGSSNNEEMISEVDIEEDLLPATTRNLPPVELPPISSKPWFVVATKADLEGAQENFLKLKEYLERLQRKEEDIAPSRKNKWTGALKVIPISAIRGEGVEQIAVQTISLLK